jgi:hypothetical protein
LGSIAKLNRERFLGSWFLGSWVLFSGSEVAKFGVLVPGFKVQKFLGLVLAGNHLGTHEPRNP